MNSRLRTVAVVLAGGVGQRVGRDTPKQLIELAGRTILEHTIAVFDASAEVDEVVVLMTPGFGGQVHELVRRAGFGKVTQVVDGGASRTESTWRALQALGTQECNVLLHDAVRPLLEPRIVTDCVRALETREAVEVAIPSSDTVLVAAPGDGGEVVGDVLDRSRLRRAQTPQGFRLSVIRKAYELAFADPGFGDRPATDDCGVVLRYLPDVPIFLVAGSERNMKVTHPIDLAIAERLLTPSAPPAAVTGRRDGLVGLSVVVFGGDLPLAAEYGARVRSFPREEVRVADPESVAKALADVAAVDAVVHLGVPARDGDEAAAYLGPWNVARAAYPALRESGGRLVLRTAPGAGPLHAPVRAATAELARSLAAEWAGVRVAYVSSQDEGALLDALVSGARP
ncbi:2-C-methyl-D-erythritol 4-phosphate cytidylyltransferase [Nonomuraea sp. NPDC049725]|uniref:2-C-methyl-D-erythritol 4-phosphate cytidylyltransferase n=1 Tax=Nonomuraea sp. NPDC049725 TaxID=3154508 RepID=UPI00342E4B6D